jgi:chromosome segregation ATPase
MTKHTATGDDMEIEAQFERANARVAEAKAETETEQLRAEMDDRLMHEQAERIRELELKLAALQSEILEREAWAQGALRIMAQITDGRTPAPD